MASTLAIELPCNYDVDTDWCAIDDVYFCDLNNSLDIPNSNVEITSVTGQHTIEKNNADVIGFRAENKTLHYLPRGLEKYFDAEKIKFIVIQETGLKEIHQGDLRPFTKLKYFSARKNDLRVIERDLFKFNPEIKYVKLSRNKIRFIDANVFQNLNNLHSLYLDWNICLSTQAIKSKEKISEVLKIIRKQCSP